MPEVDSIVEKFCDKLAKWIADNPDNSNIPNHKRDLNAMKEMLKEVKRLRLVTKPVSKEHGDLSDLPEDLVAELSASKTDDLESQIYTIIKAANGSANIDTILIELYRRFGVSQKRRFLTNKLWRMTQKSGVLWTTDEKGVYSTEEPDEPDEEVYDVDDIEVPF